MLVVLLVGAVAYVGVYDHISHVRMDGFAMAYKCDWICCIVHCLFTSNRPKIAAFFSVTESKVCAFYGISFRAPTED